MLSSEHEALFQEALQNDVAVATCYQLFERGVLSELDAMKMCVAFLAQRAKTDLALLKELDGIKPRRYRLPDGRIARFNAPDSEVPVTDISAPILERKEPVGSS